LSLGENLVTNPRLQCLGRHHVDVDAEEFGELALERGESDDADTAVEIHQEVDVAGRGVLASRDAAEHPHVVSSAFRCYLDDGPAATPKSPPKRCVR